MTLLYGALPGLYWYAALRLEQNNDTYSWHGWNKQQITTFLDRLSPRCSLVVGVWETVPGEAGIPEREELALGVVCEVVNGEVHSICTFQALTSVGLKPELEPGVDDALEIMRAARRLVAPVAWCCSWRNRPGMSGFLPAGMMAR